MNGQRGRKSHLRTMRKRARQKDPGQRTQAQHDTSTTHITSSNIEISFSITKQNLNWNCKKTIAWMSTNTIFIERSEINTSFQKTREKMFRTFFMCLNNSITEKAQENFSTPESQTSKHFSEGGKSLLSGSSERLYYKTSSTMYMFIMFRRFSRFYKGFLLSLHLHGLGWFLGFAGP